MLSSTKMRQRASVQNKKALDGIAFVLSCPDNDLLWYIVEAYYGENMHPDTSLAEMRYLVMRVAEEIRKNINQDID